jgi:glycosyltransferase involved in cell wall biosynthesis
MKKFSFIMPTLNQETYIAEAIQSVLGQTYKKWELIIINDGCTDATDKVVNYYVNKYPDKIKYLSNEKNLGMGLTRNKGIAASDGDYIVVIDSDDYSHPERLKKALPYLKKYDFIYTDYVNCDTALRAESMYSAPSVINLENIAMNASVPHGTVIANRKCFVENPYDDLRVNEDGYMWLHWFKAGYTYKHITFPSILVREHPKRCSNTELKEVKEITKRLKKDINV